MSTKQRRENAMIQSAKQLVEKALYLHFKQMMRMLASAQSVNQQKIA